MNPGHRLCIQHIHDYLSRLLQIFQLFLLTDLFDENDVLLIHSSDKIFRMGSKHTPHRLQRTTVLFLIGLDDKSNSSCIHFYMKFFGTVKDIHHEQIIKKKILYKIILVISFLIGYQ